MKLEGNVAIVTGGGQGIGEGIVRCLAEEGADVAVIDLNGDNAHRVADEVARLGRRSLTIETDVTDNEKVTAAVEAVLDHFGALDILVNNVGGATGDPDIAGGIPNIATRTEEEWQRSYELNLANHIHMARAVVPHLLKQQSGKIVNIASVAGRRGSAMLMPYSVFKAGVIALTRTLALELAGSNINVNCICPGLVYTPLWERGAAALRELAITVAKAGGPTAIPLEDLEKMTPREWWLKATVGASTPMGREQTPEDMGRAAVFLVSDDAKNITGQSLNIDGGQFMD